MNVVKLQQQTHLLAGSGVETTRQGYGKVHDESWD